jgi:hypothetical protein
MSKNSFHFKILELQKIFLQHTILYGMLQDLKENLKAIFLCENVTKRILFFKI